MCEGAYDMSLTSSRCQEGFPESDTGARLEALEESVRKAGGVVRTPSRGRQSHRGRRGREGDRNRRSGHAADAEKG